MRRLKLLLVALMLSAAAPIAAADSIFVGSSGSLKAQADFAESGNKLVITLTNTSTATTSDNTSLLLGLFFDIKGSPTLTASSAVLPSGSRIVNASGGDPGSPLSTTTDVSGEWGYAQTSSAMGFSGATFNSHYGLAAAGLAFNTPINPGADLDADANGHNPDLGGPDFGITSAGSTQVAGNAAQDVIKNAITFTLNGLPSGFNLSDVCNVHFQYGTSFDEPSFGGSPPAVPAPGSLAGGALLLASLWIGRAKWRARAALA